MIHPPKILSRLQRSINIVHNPGTGWIILGLSLVLTFAAYWFASNQVEERAKERFEFRAKEVSDAIYERLLMYEQALNGAVGLFNASDHVSQRDWQAYVAALRLSERLPGIQGIGYAVPVAPDEKNAFVESVQKKGVENFHITPEGERPEYSAILYLEPLDWRNRRALGYDMWSDAVRRAAMTRARDDGIPSLSGAITLVQETENNMQKGFLMYLPVYDQVLGEQALVEERRNRFVGWVYAPFRAEDFMQGILGMSDPDLEFEVYDGGDGTRESLLFDSDGQLSALESTSSPEYSIKLNLPLQGREWSIFFSTDLADANYIEESRQPLYILLAGIVVDTLLFYVLISLHLINRHVRATERDLLKKYKENQRDLAEQARLIQTSEAESETFFQLAPEAFLVVDVRGVVIKANHAAHVLFDFAQDDLRGAAVGDLVPDIAKLHTQPAPINTNASGWNAKSPPIVLLGRKRNGDTFPVTINLVPIEINGQRHTVAAVHDVSAQKKVEQTLADAKERAESANRSKTEFLANMSHEIRTPLNAVLGAAQLLSKGKTNRAQQRYIHMIRASGEALSGVINDILDLSKIEAGRMELTPVLFDLNEVLSRVSVLMSVSAGEKDLELVIDVDPRVNRLIIADPLRLQQVLINLVSNAIKFTSGGSVVLRVELNDRFDDGKQVLRFSCKDTGIGLENQQQQRLFKAFFQADASITRKFGGTGLGLAISSRIIEMMGSRIQLVSEPGRGSTFFFDIILPSAPAKPTVPDFLEKRQRRILIVDDSKETGKVLRNIFNQWRWPCKIVETSEDLVVLQSLKEYDFLLFDYGISSLSDQDCLKQLRANGLSPQCGCILLVGNHQQSQWVQQGEGMSFHSVLLKPFLSDSLLTALQEASLAATGSVLYKEEDAGHGKPSRLRDVAALVVEDNLFNQTVVKGLLEEMGVQSETASNGYEALEKVSAQPTRFDVVLMDIQMPVMDGVTASRQMHKNPHFTAPVIALTAGVLPSDREQYTRAGIADFIAKPIDGNELFRVLVRHLPKRKVSRTNRRLPPPVAHGNPEALPAVFNEQQLMSLTKGKPQRIQQLADTLDALVQSADNYLRQARQGINDGDAEQTRFALHSLKGLVANYGGDRLAEMIAKMEASLREKWSDGPLSVDWPGLEKGFAEFVTLLREWTDRQRSVLTESDDHDEP